MFLSGTYNILVIVIGVIADVAMYLQLKKKEEIQEKRNKNEPIPWKSGSHKESVLKMPLNATILSSCLLLVIFVLHVILAQYVGKSNFLFKTLPTRLET